MGQKVNHTIQNQLRTSTWETGEYYQTAHEASQSDHPALQAITQLCQGKHVLEVGCGEGSKLSALPASFAVGTDISFTGLKLARHHLANAVQANSERLPFKSNSFECVISLFTLEHLTDPQTVINDMIRVTRPGGLIIFLAPNFGAPNRASPCHSGSRIKKLITGFMADFNFFSQPTIPWQTVTPKAISQTYQVDYDTTVEPYLRTLSTYLQFHKLDIMTADSNWNIHMENESLLQKMIKFMGQRTIYPFTFWGPHLFLVARKKQ